MHVLAITFGSRGDVQPYVSLGTALRADGHRMTIATGRGFEEMIEAQGLTAAPMPIDFRELIDRPEMQRALRSISGKIEAWRSLKGLMRQLLDEMWDISRQVQPDLIVFHVKAAAATHIGEALGVPAVPTFQIPAMVPTGEFASPLLRIPNLGRCINRLSHQALVKLTTTFGSGMVRDWRANTLGLTAPGPRNPIEGYDPGGSAVQRIHGYSRHIVPRPADWQDREIVTGYWFPEASNDWSPPDALVGFLNAGPAPVYVGFGSMPAENTEDLTNMIVEAVTASGDRAIIASGWAGLTAQHLPDTIHLLDAAPHDWLFPRCSAVIHHGGSGTTHEGLRWGRPSFICPVFGDQPFWGARVASLGAGPKPVAQKKLTCESLRGALVALKDTGVVERAGKIGTAIQTEGGAAAAAQNLRNCLP